MHALGCAREGMSSGLALSTGGDSTGGLRYGCSLIHGAAIRYICPTKLRRNKINDHLWTSREEVFSNAQTTIEVRGSGGQSRSRGGNRLAWNYVVFRLSNGR